MVTVLTRRELLSRRHSKPGTEPAALAAPQRLHSLAVTTSLVELGWRRSRDHHPEIRYQVLRDGHVVAHVRGERFTDRAVAAATTYRYAVRTLDGKRHGHSTRILVVTTPALVSAPVAQSPAPASAPEISRPCQCLLLRIASKVCTFTRHP